MDYAMIQNSLGNSYHQLAEYEGKVEKNQKALTAYQEALKVYTMERFPMVYGITQINIQAIYCVLADAEERPEYYRSAFKAYEEALKVFTEAKYPEKNKLIRSEIKNWWIN